LSTTAVSSGNAFQPPYSFTSETGPRSFIAGLSLEALINSRFSVEADALHRSYWAKNIATVNPGSSAASTSSEQFIASTTWEFPVLFKYSMSANRWQPFLDGGMSFRSLERTSLLDPSRYGNRAWSNPTHAAASLHALGRAEPKQWLLRLQTRSVGILNGH